MVYVRPGQTSAAQLLGNTDGSAKYVEFLKSLGDVSFDCMIA